MNANRFTPAGTEGTRVRPSPIAGQWYPGTADRLRSQITSFLQGAQVAPIDGQIVGLVVPHAGITYSGEVAAHAYRLVQGKSYEVVAIVAPNHRIVNNAPYLVADYAAYSTPLGNVAVDEELLAQVDSRLGLTRIQRDEEHSLEIQLPFLQVALADSFRLLPIMLNDRSPRVVRALGKVLAETLRDQNVLLVASTDLSHFYDAQTAAQLDRTVTARIARFDPEGLLDVLETGEGQACGGGPVVAAMLAAQDLGADHARILKYANSGDVTGDYRRVVGYAAAVLYAGSQEH
jgi:AmmeMemoRadiSam system protein B